MEAGRELDALVAEKVMGWKHVSDSEHWAIGWNGSSIRDAHDRFPVRSYSSFCPSTDIAAAWEVVEKMRGLGFHACIHQYEGNKEWTAQFDRHELDVIGVNSGAHADTAPLAICKAALRAVGWK